MQVDLWQRPNIYHCKRIFLLQIDNDCQCQFMVYTPQVHLHITETVQVFESSPVWMTIYHHHLQTNIRVWALPAVKVNTMKYRLLCTCQTSAMSNFNIYIYWPITANDINNFRFYWSGIDSIPSAQCVIDTWRNKSFTQWVAYIKHCNMINLQKILIYGHKSWRN